MSFLTTDANGTQWFHERLHKGLSQGFEVRNVLLHKHTDHQDLIIFENPTFGRVMALDGAIQITERDEFCYQEMMVHVPLFSHPVLNGEGPKNVLIIGGGDGGIARECLKHNVRVTMVELDETVVNLSRQYLPGISATDQCTSAFDDDRLTLVFADGAAFIREANKQFDVIIVDSTDPEIGARDDGKAYPGATLFSSQFYENCAKRLTDAGILVTQNGVPFLQADELKNSIQSFRQYFADACCYLTSVPTYYGGLMTLGWASHDISNRQQSLAELKQRVVAAGIADLKYYTPTVHQAAFALPTFIASSTGNNIN